MTGGRRFCWTAEGRRGLVPGCGLVVMMGWAGVGECSSLVHGPEGICIDSPVIATKASHAL